MDRVSVIIPAFNSAAFLSRAVESVFATGYAAVDVVIVDDGSTDTTLVIAKELCRRFEGKCAVVRHPGGTNLGVSASRNLGVRSSFAKWIAFLDSDDVYLPGRFAVLEAGTGNDSAGKADGFHGLARVVLLDSSADSNWWDRGGADLFGVRADVSGPTLLEQMVRHGTWHTSAITVDRELLVSTGLFDPGKRIAEDCDVWYRIAASGVIARDPGGEPVSEYHRHASNSYSYSLDHRPALLLAMLDAWRWAEGARVPADCLGVFREEVPRQALRAVVACREAGRRDLARRVVKMMLARKVGRFFANPQAVRQIASLARESVFRVSASSGEQDAARRDA